jgi:hypothetical protein
MISRRGVPSPELLAAYADGELDRDAALAPYKNQVEQWLAAHPEAAHRLEEQQRLQELWRRTTPKEPASATWSTVLARIESAPRQPAARRGPRYWGRIAGLLALTAAALWLALSLLPGPDGNQKASLVDPADDANEALPVALAEEIEILSVEEKDAPSLVVGELPVRGPLELLAPGEMDVTSVQPADRDNMVPDYPRQGPATPMIWAHLDSER